MYCGIFAQHLDHGVFKDHRLTNFRAMSKRILDDESGKENEGAKKAVKHSLMHDEVRWSEVF
jgi:hypothetical protein